MKIRSVVPNNRKRAFEVETSSRTYVLPYVKSDPQPTTNDRVVQVFVDEELAHEGFTYALRSGKEGSVHLDQVLEYNKDPGYLRNIILYRLTLEARKQVDSSRLSKREIVRRLGTSAAQLYRLLDQANYSKSVDQLLALLHVLDCDVDLVIHSHPVRAE